MNLMHRALLALGIVAATLTAAHAQQGVADGEIVIGTIQDLSGPVSSFGKQSLSGMQSRVDEINAAGGINGRKLVLKVEDNGYDPRKAVLAAQKLVNRDRVFAIVGHLGTAVNNAAMPIQFSRNVINWMPLTAAREMHHPFHKLKFALLASYYDQMRVGLPELAKTKPFSRPCIIYQDDEYGLEVLRGAEDGLAGMKTSFVEKTSFKRGATDFSSQVARMKSANCDLVVMGTIIRETIGTISEARKTGFSPTFLGSGATYTDLIHKLGGGAMDGLYAMHQTTHPYLDHADQRIRVWAAKYKAAIGEDPTVFSVYGYMLVEHFSRAVRAAGQDLTTETFVKAAETTAFPADIFGTPALRYGPDRRIGNDQSRMAQIQKGRWVEVTDYLPTPPAKP